VPYEIEWLDADRTRASEASFWREVHAEPAPPAGTEVARATLVAPWWRRLLARIFFFTF